MEVGIAVAIGLVVVGAVLFRAPFVMGRVGLPRDGKPYAREGIMLVGLVVLITGAGLYFGLAD